MAVYAESGGKPVSGFLAVPTADEMLRPAISCEAWVLVYEDFVAAFSYPLGQRNRSEGLDDAWGESMGFFDKHLDP